MRHAGPQQASTQNTANPACLPIGRDPRKIKGIASSFATLTPRNDTIAKNFVREQYPEATHTIQTQNYKRPRNEIASPSPTARVRNDTWSKLRVSPPACRQAGFGNRPYNYFAGLSSLFFIGRKPAISPITLTSSVFAGITIFALFTRDFSTASNFLNTCALPTK